MMNFVTWICRILVGVLFIISGLIKANDPIGFSIKLNEYFTVFGMEWLHPITVGLSMFICVFEVACGVAAITGFKAKLNSLLLLLMIVFFTFLTFYSAYFNKVTDCGCFGDAIKLTPWQSFTKDIVLLILILPIFIMRNKIKDALPAKLNFTVVTLATVLATAFTMYCYMHLPVKDFRPYAIGKNILKQMEVPEGAPVDVYATILKYKNLKTNVVKEFTQDEYMKSKLWEDTLTWAWDTTISKLVSKGYTPPIHDFKIQSQDGSTDYTNDILTTKGYTFLVICYDITKTTTAVQANINALAQGLQQANVPIYGISASPYSLVDNFRHEHQIMYDYYSCDETALKTMIRSNPGIILLKEGTVVNMWHANDVPTIKDIQATYLAK
ncbi:MAG: BT_3928 family protein [Bacteroidia bacterium]